MDDVQSIRDALDGEECYGHPAQLMRWLTAKGEENPDGAVKETLGVGCHECGCLWDVHRPDLATVLAHLMWTVAKPADSVLAFRYGFDRSLPEGPVDFVYLEQLRNRYEAIEDVREMA